MRRLTAATLLAFLAVGTIGCEKIRERVCPAEPEIAAEPAGSAAPAGASAAPAPGPSSVPAETPDEYILPFAWETSDKEPLGKARAFLSETVSVNTIYSEQFSDRLKRNRDDGGPRVTLLTCSDPVVQTPALAETPENDAYVVRNWGTRVEADPETLAFGVEKLSTPLLLILGHTGCAAISAAHDHESEMHAALRQALTGAKPSEKDSTEAKGPAAPTKRKRKIRKDNADEVVNHIHRQVDLALEHFGKRVQAGKLTIVGAVLDIDNELRKGPGRLVVVNVNANREQRRLDAFLEAVGKQGQ